MSVQTQQVEPQTAALAPPPLAAVPARRRGSLTIADGVVSKVAQAAALRVPGVLPVPRRLLGDRLGVQARVLGGVAILSLEVAMPYPSPVKATTVRLREQVVAEVRRTTGVEVTRLDVQIADLTHRSGRLRRVV